MTICERQSGGRILCIRLSGLGDVVHALNALSLLRAERPDAYIAWLVEERFASLLHGHPCIDELITVPRTDWAAMLASPRHWHELWQELKRFALRLRESRFDVSVDFQSSLKSAWVVRAAGAPVRIGFDRGVNRELNWLVQNCRVRVPRRGVHRIERDVALLAPLGIRSRYAEPVLPVDPEARRTVDAGLQGRLGGGPLVVMHPGTSLFATFKRWSPARYARVADALIEQRGADVVVSYGPEDRDMAAEVVRQMGRKPVGAPPTASLSELTALLARASLFIGSDTGPMHMAGALGVPVVSLFGPKDALQTGPYTSRSIVVTADVPCRPCTRRRCSHPRCMNAISAGQVLDAALRVLDGGGECRGQPGLLKLPCTWDFKLGEWRGRVTTAYSDPAFFTRLCDPDAFASGKGAASPAMDEPPARGAGARLVDAVVRMLADDRPLRQTAFGPRAVASVPDGAGGRFAAEQLPPAQTSPEQLLSLVGLSPARRAWRSMLALRERGVPAPFPVCRMDAGPRWSRREMLVGEEVEGAVPLNDWLAGRGWPGWRAASHAQKVELTRAVAELLRTFHAAGCVHVGIRAGNILARLPQGGTGGPPEVCLVDLDRVVQVGGWPSLVRDVLCALDLRRLVRTVPVRLSTLEAVRFFRAYCRGFIPPGHRRRAIVQYAMR